MDLMRHSIAMLEALDEAFPLSPTLTAPIRGGTFTPSVLRGFLLILGHIIIYVSPSGIWTHFRAGLRCHINAPHSQWMRPNRLLRKY
jgi:hypothetical protein